MNNCNSFLLSSIRLLLKVITTRIFFSSNEMTGNLFYCPVNRYTKFELNFEIFFHVILDHRTSTCY